MDYLKNLLVGTTFDFVGWRRLASSISALVVAASWILFALVGPNYGIDFTGGTEIHLKFDQDVQVGDVRDALHKLGLTDDAVQQIGASDAHEFVIRIQDPEFGAREVREKVETGLRTAFGDTWIKETTFNAEVGARLTVTYDPAATTVAINPSVVRDALADLDVANVASGRDENQVVITLPGLAEQVKENVQGALGDRKFEVLAIDAVGPKVGAELQRQAVISIGATLVLVLIYIAFRFDIAFAPGAILALIHDVSVTVGIFVVFQLEFNLPMIGALLTIVGYSLNDTIIIYDRIRENQERYRRKDLSDLINVSINETLGRTLATTMTTLMAVTAFLFVGGPVIQNFTLAMFIGMIFGTYSTVYVAAPMLLVMEDLRPWLSRLIAVPAPVPANGPPLEGEQLDEGLSESEKRRREREQGDE